MLKVPKKKRKNIKQNYSNKKNAASISLNLGSCIRLIKATEKLDVSSPIYSGRKQHFENSYNIKEQCL